ncbi:MAG: class I SAM-dependent methyltransferase [Methanocella sp.]
MAQTEETHWEQVAKTRMGKYITQVEVQFIKNSLGANSLEMVLDVGAEAGRFSQLSSNAQTVSIDIDKKALKRLQKKAPDTLIVQADARHLPLKDGLFDAITMIEVLDYIPELQMVFQEAHRTLKPKSPLILSFGNRSSLKAKLRQLSGKSYTHAYSNVINTLKRSNFSVVKKTGYNWLLFGRMSQNPLIPLLAKLEWALGFRRIPSLSPWVIVHATKTDGQPIK